MRVDTTVVETNIHYPTDSSLLGDGARVLTRTMKKIEAKTGGLRQKIRDRMRTVKKRVMAIALATRQPGPQREERSEEHTSELQSRLHLVCRLLLEKKKNRSTDRAVHVSATG